MSNGNGGSGGAKHFNIIVNGTQEVWTDNHITYEQVVQLAFPGETGFLYTVTYSNPHGKDGSLAAGQRTTVHDGMVFTVGKTNRS
jgi:Multiubiquitin